MKRLVGKTVRHSSVNVSDAKSSLSSSDTSISLKSESSGYTSGVGSRVRLLLLVYSSCASICVATVFISGKKTVFLFWRNM